DDFATQCGAPETPTYTCQPIDPSTAGEHDCHGGPSWRSDDDGSDAPVVHIDSELVFPDGCDLTLPECAVFYPNTPRVIECRLGRWAEPV
ncbi:MAG TPA: hypothetical protein VGC41_27445, partial [Kofleriaceae bacterium]